MMELDRMVVLVSGVVAFAAAAVLLVQLAMVALRVRRGADRDRAPAAHRVVAAVLVAATLVHGVGAFLEGSDVNVLVYAFGCLAGACVIAAGTLMLPPVKHRIGAREGLHRALFACAIVLFALHGACAH